MQILLLAWAAQVSELEGQSISKTTGQAMGRMGTVVLPCGFAVLPPKLSVLLHSHDQTPKHKEM